MQEFLIDCKGEQKMLLVCMFGMAVQSSQRQTSALFDRRAQTLAQLVLQQDRTMICKRLTNPAETPRHVPESHQSCTKHCKRVQCRPTPVHVCDLLGHCRC